MITSEEEVRYLRARLANAEKHAKCEYERGAREERKRILAVFAKTYAPGVVAALREEIEPRPKKRKGQ